MDTATGISDPATVDAPHLHHWRIEEPRGPVSEGSCRGCGAANLFRNSLSEIEFVTTEERRAAAEAA